MIARTRSARHARSSAPRDGARQRPAAAVEARVVCSFCGRDGTEVAFAVIDPEHVNVCEPCMGECVRQYAITCVC